MIISMLARLMVADLGDDSLLHEGDGNGKDNIDVLIMMSSVLAMLHLVVELEDKRIKISFR